MTIFYIIFALLVCVYSCSGYKPSTYGPSECIIKNVEYQDDFLYTSKDIEYGSQDQRRKVYSNPVSTKYMRYSNQKKWLFIPADENGKEMSSNSTYYIINGQYIEFLCASSDHLELTKRRRKIYTLYLDETKVEDDCKWRLDPVNTHKDGYVIWNLKFKEPLYAASRYI
jgi:hypothetical protein